MTNMRASILAIVGALVGAAILVVATFAVNGTTLHSFQTLDQQARAQDKGVASTSAQPCSNPRIQVNAPIRVLQVSQTEAIHAQVTNQDSVECDITLSLVASGFSLQPVDNQRLVQLQPTQSSTLTWNVTPTTVGLFTLAFTAGNASQQIGMNVISANGFIPFQSQTFDYLAIFLGFLLTTASLLTGQRWVHRSTAPESGEAKSKASVLSPDQPGGAPTSP
jgi:hypothetical protein